MLPNIEQENTKKGAQKLTPEQRDEILVKVLESVSTESMKSVSDTSVARIVTDFAKSIELANKDLVENLVDEDKTLLKDVVKEISKLQGKNSEDLKRLGVLAEKILLSADKSGNEKLKGVGERLKESVLQEKFQDANATLTGDQDTFKNRFMRNVTGKTPAEAKVQGTSIFGSVLKDFSYGFRKGLGDSFVKDEERRERIRAKADYENKKVALAESSASDFGKILDSVNSPDQDKFETGGGEQTTSLSNPDSKPDTASRSDEQELRAGIRDTDPAFSRSATDSIDPWETRWADLMDTLNKIKDCVCTCQCTGSGFPGLPLPVPLPTPVSTKTPVRVAERVAATRSIPITATAAEQLSLAKPIAQPTLLPSQKVATAKPLQLTQQRAGPTLEELGIKRTVKEKVPVRATAQPVYQSKELSVAERLRTGQISNAEEAKRIHLAERASGKTIGAAERTTVPGPKVEPEVAAARNRRPNENITTEEGRNNWRARRIAESSEDALLRRLMESGRRNNSTTGSSGSLVPVRGTTAPTKPWYSRAWEGTKSAGSRAWDATKRTVSGGWEKAKGLGTSGWNKVTSGAERFGKWSANTRVGQAVVGATESRVGKGISSAASKVANSGAVKWGGRALGVLGAGLDIYNRKKQGQSNTKVAAGVGSGLAGAALGAKAGAVAGGAVGSLFFGVGAAPGAAIGGFLGGVGGYFAGSGAGDWVYDKITGEKKPASEAKPGDKKPAKVAAVTAPRQNPMAREGVVSPVAAKTMSAPTTGKTAGLETGRNLDGAVIERGTDMTAKSAAPVINVPPPTVIQAPANTQQSPVFGSGRDYINARPTDNTWLRFQEKRAVA